MVPLNGISFFVGNFGNVLKTNNFSYSKCFKNDAVESMGGRDNSWVLIAWLLIFISVDRSSSLN